MALLESNHELQFRRDLTNDGVSCYVPLGVRYTRPKGKHREVGRVVPLIPGYAFVLVKQYAFVMDKAKLARGFRRFLFVNGEIARIRKQDVWALKRREEAGEFGKPKEQEIATFELGEMVRAKDDRFAGLSGVIVDFRKKAGTDYVQIDVKGMKFHIELAMLEKTGH